MDTPIPIPYPTSLEAVAEAADGNFVVHAGWVQRQLPGMVVDERDDLVWVDSGLACDTFNFICRARLDGVDRGVALARVRGAVERFERVGRPFSWWVGPADRPGDLGEVLVAAGLERSETELAMAAELAELDVAGAAPAGLRIERVRSEAALRDFARVSAANWQPPDQDVVRFYELATSVLLSDGCPLWLYVGYVDGEAVGTAEMTVGGGVVGLYNISTAPPFRRRGFGTALTLRPLLDARERGWRTGVLQAAPDGVSIYERVGFRPFGNITEYKPAVGFAGSV